MRDQTVITHNFYLILVWWDSITSYSNFWQNQINCHQIVLSKWWKNQMNNVEQVYGWFVLNLSKIPLLGYIIKLVPAWVKCKCVVCIWLKFGNKIFISSWLSWQCSQSDLIWMIVISYFILTALPSFISAAVSNVDFHLNENLIWTSMKKLLLNLQLKSKPLYRLGVFYSAGFITKDITLKYMCW